MQGSLFGIQLMTAQELAAKVMHFFQKYTLTMIGSILIFAAGWLIAVFIGKMIKRMLVKRNADVTITKFLVDIIVGRIRVDGEQKDNRCA